jgi:hypothetical protein
MVGLWLRLVKCGGGGRGVVKGNGSIEDRWELGLASAH